MRSQAILCIIAIVILAQLAMAGPTDERSETVLLDIPESITAGQQGWRLYLISVPQFEQGDWNLTSTLAQAFKNYKTAKSLCGGKGVFFDEVRPLTPEELGSVTCVIDGRINETHCNTTTSDKPECLSYIPYKIEKDYREDISLLTFGAYYKSHVYDIGRADFYHHFEPLECSIIDNSCEMRAYLREELSNPFVAVLENTLSKDKIYLSEPISISCLDQLNVGSFPACENLPCAGEFLCKQDIYEMKVEGHKLSITFGQKKPISKSITLAGWLLLISLLALLILALGLIFLRLKRGKRNNGKSPIIIQ